MRRGQKRGSGSPAPGAAYGPPAPYRGWRGPGGGRAANVDTGAVYLGTTAQLAGLFPFIQSSGLPSTGVPIGRDLLTAELVCLDPPGWVGRLTANPGVWVQASPGVGKALDVGTPIATPRGWRAMGELAPGDEVFDERGFPTFVLAVTEAWADRPCFEVVFSDGSAIVADAEHLWVTQTLGARERAVREPGQNGTTTARAQEAAALSAYDRLARLTAAPPLTTRQIRATLTLGGRLNHAVPVAPPLRLPEADLEDDPRLLGLRLGTQLGRPGRVPTEYLWASEAQRRALLSGLLDAGGRVTRAGQVVFATGNGDLAEDVHQLACSLGHRATLDLDVTGLDGRGLDGTAGSWTVGFTTSEEVFYQPGKHALHQRLTGALAPGHGLRYVTEVRPVPSRPVRCIQVAADSGMFLAGRTFVPTHNSAIAKRIMIGLSALGYLALNPGDPKGEYSPVVRGLGGQVVRIGRGLDRINPLDSGPLGRALPRLPMERQESLAVEVAARRSELLVALLATPHGLDRRPTAAERFALEQAVRLLTAAHAGREDPLIPDVVRVLRDPPAELLGSLKARTAAVAWGITAEVTFALENLCSGPLGGLFDGPTSTPLDLTAPAVSVDLSALLSTGDHVVAAGMLATWAYTYGALDAAAALGISHRPMVIPLDEMWRALRAGTGMVDSFDSLTRLNRAKGAVTLMITHSLRDLEALPSEADRAKAAGLMERCDTLILGASSPKELASVSERKPLTSEEIRLISSWATPVGTAVDGVDQQHPGRGKMLIKIGHRIGVPTQLMLTQAELNLYDTDAAMRHRPGGALGLTIPVPELAARGGGVA